MNRLVSTTAIAALTLLVSLPALSASAAPVTLAFANNDPLPGQAISVTGDGDDCPLDASGNPGTFIVTLTYTIPAGGTAKVEATGNVGIDGTFASSITLPETAVAASPANGTSSTTCSGVATASNQVDLKVTYHPGSLTLSAKSVAAGGTITATADSCYGGEFVVVYGATGGDPNTFNDGTSGVPAVDRSFTSTLSIPAAQAAGSYDVYALCPGTLYAAKKLTITEAPPTAPVVTVPAVPASPVAVATATLGGGFTNDLTTGRTTSGTGTSGAGTSTGAGTKTPVATAPVAVKGEASFTG